MLPVLTSQLQTWPDIRPLASTDGSRGLNSLTNVADAAFSVIQGSLGLSAACCFFAVFLFFHPVVCDSPVMAVVERENEWERRVCVIFVYFKNYTREILFRAIRGVPSKHTHTYERGAFCF